MQTELTPERLAAFTRSELSTFVLTGLGIDPVRASRWIQGELLGEFELNRPETQEKRHSFFAIEATTAADYTEYLVELDRSSASATDENAAGEGHSSARTVWCGIRHLGLNREVPFVHLRPSVPFASKADVLATYAAIADRFKVFRPKLVRIHDRHVQWAEAPGNQYLACGAPAVLSRTPWPREEELTLVRQTDGSASECLDWYERGYARFHSEHPELRDVVAVNSRAVMESSLEQGLFYSGEFEGKRIGLIAACREKLLGRPGLYFLEIFIARDWRGQGWARVLQGKFLREVCTGNELVWGTIDGRNQPSLRTAMANGRRAIRHELFISV